MNYCVQNKNNAHSKKESSLWRQCFYDITTLYVSNVYLKKENNTL